MPHAEPNHVLRTLMLTLNIVGGLVVAFVLLAGSWLVFGSLAYNTGDASRQIESFRELLQDEARIRAEHAKLREHLQAARQQDAALQKRIPDGPHEADFLAQVSHAAGELGVQISDYRPGKLTEGKSCWAMRVELSCEGNYRNICRLLDRLQELPRHSTVAKLTMDSGATPDKHLAKIGLELYFFGSGRALAER